VTLHADDTQLYLQCRRDDMASTALQLERCLTDVSHWMSANRLELNADKTELLWAGSRRCCLSLGNRGPKLQLREGTITIVPINDVKVLRVTLSSDLTMDKHVSNVCSAGFYRLRQLRRVRRSLDKESPATLVHAFVTPRIDYCNVLLAGAPKATTDKLQRLLNAAARLLSFTKKFGRGLSQVMHVNLHWLDVPERVKYKLVTMVNRPNCLHGKAPSYLIDCCTPISDVVSRRHLRSASHRQLFVLVPGHNLSMAVGLFLSQVRLPGTACATNCVNRC